MSSKATSEFLSHESILSEEFSLEKQTKGFALKVLELLKNSDQLEKELELDGNQLKSE